jgi:hypothetical protein
MLAEIDFLSRLLQAPAQATLGTYFKLLANRTRYWHPIGFVIDTIPTFYQLLDQNSKALRCFVLVKIIPKKEGGYCFHAL